MGMLLCFSGRFLVRGTLPTPLSATAAGLPHAFWQLADADKFAVRIAQQEKSYLSLDCLWD
jgi:hypothetical protein